MKKHLVTLLLAFVFMLSPAIPALTPQAKAAQVGSVAGYYYYTDIVTYMWAAPVNSINIGGRTLIDAESLSHYGFEVVWHADTRRLELLFKGPATDNFTFDGSLLTMKAGKPGAIAGRYYYTDIVTTLDGQVIESFNIGGRTFIPAEVMADYGYTVTWDGMARTLTIDFPAPPPPLCEPWTIGLYNSYECDEVDLSSLTLTAKRPDSTSDFTVSGSGYTALSFVSLGRDNQKRLYFSFSIYQYVGMWAMSRLSTPLRNAVSYEYGTRICPPEDVRDALNQLVQISVNGEQVTIRELHYGQGNGQKPLKKLYFLH